MTEMTETKKLLVEELVLIGFKYGYFSDGKSLKENNIRKDKAKAEIHRLLQEAKWQ